jgi:putative transposase
MTQPRQILPGQTVLVTVRAVHRLFKFVPTDDVNALLQYAVAYAADQHGVGVVAMTWLSNHGHLLVNDHEGTLPAFTQTLNMIIARAVNATRGDRGSVFERNNVDHKLVVGRDGALIALAYVAANPVAAGCVEHGHEWPGIRSRAKLMGRDACDVSRPDQFFRHRHQGYRGRLPKAVPMRYELPLCVASSDRGVFLHDAEVAIAEAEERARDEVRRKGRTFLGSARCRRASPDTRARSWEPAGPGSGPDPILATCTEEKRHLEDALADFHDTYRSAWSRWQCGERNVAFPRGTWHLVRCHRARTGTAPAPDAA